MAITTLNLPVQKMAYIDEANPDTHYTLSRNTWYSLNKSGAGTTKLNKQMLFSLAALPDSLNHNKLYGVQFAFFVSAEAFDECVVYPNFGTFDKDTVTYNTQPTLVKGYDIALRYFSSAYQGDILAPSSIDRSTDNAYDAYQALHYGSLRLMGGYLNKTMSVRTVLSNSSTPYAIVTYDDDAKVRSKITYRSGPVSGYFNPREPAVFSWTYTKANSGEYCASPVWSQSSASFCWRTASDSTLHRISAGSDTTLTVSANTFPTNESITWYVIGTDEDGTSTFTESYTFSTAAGTASATPISPAGSIEDGSVPIAFSWAISSSDGQAPNRAEGQWRQQGADTWSSLFDLTPAEDSFEAASGTFPAGQTEWRVRAYNIDDIPGDWATASFVCQDAPPQPSGLSATNVPRTTIRWQSSGQEAYEISVDGVVLQKDFGNVTSWTVTEPLQDGEHEIQVRVQGIYGLWSQPSSVFVQISNAPETTIALAADFGIDATLAADAGQISAAEKYQWYRDGVRIGSTKAPIFMDRFVLGSHRYYVEIWHDSGNYSRSNEVSGVLSVRGMWIALFSGGEWLDITLTDKTTSVQQYSLSSVISSRHVTGSRFPDMERSTFQDNTGSFSCAFRDHAAAETLEAMQGQMVIVKTRRGKIVVGCLADLTCMEYVFYSAYSFRLQQAEWEDFVNDEND